MADKKSKKNATAEALRAISAKFEQQLRRGGELLQEQSRINMELLQAKLKLQQSERTLETVDAILAGDKLKAIELLRQPLKLNLDVQVVHGWEAAEKDGKIKCTYKEQKGESREAVKAE